MLNDMKKKVENSEDAAEVLYKKQKIETLYVSNTGKV